MDTRNNKVDPIDLSEIRQLAKQSLNDGAVTQDYPLDLQMACKLLNDALATEIVCILRYRQHQIVASGIDYIQVAAEFAEHALEEEQHMLLLAERISQLGGTPDFNPATIMQRTASEYNVSSNLETMIQQDLVAERVAIMVYKKLIQWFGDADPTTRRLLEQILEQEEEHANDLAGFLTARPK